MEEKKKVNIGLNIIISIIVVLLIVITVLLVSSKLKQTGQENKIISNTTKTPEIQQTEPKDDFPIKFLQMENKNKNIVYSPLSIKYALNMLNEGANGNTKAQIENAINGLSLPQYNNIEKVASLANAVYIRDNYKQNVKEDYINILKGKYNAEVNYDSFHSANNINNWIENKTLGIIKNMLSDGFVQRPNVQMLLINALAIDMEWENQFDCMDTTGNEFKLADGSTMNATTLHNEVKDENVTYYKDNDITALTMNLKKYNDLQLDFTAIMPNENLSDYINNFTTEEFKSIIKKSIPSSKTENGIKASIPKFSFEYDLDLKNDLQQLGITDAFDDKSDFTNMTKKNLWVNDALHKADIDFTEKGVKAAAVTVMAMMDGYYMRTNDKEEVKFDKPFLYVIRDKSNGEIWFLGAVYEPHSWEDDKAEYQYN